MTAVDERTIYAKLEAMKDIRSKTLQLEKVKLKIVREVENGDAEEKCLAEYRRELEMLMQEKMSHFSKHSLPLQTTTAADEVVSVVPPADPPERPDLPAVQGQKSLAQPEEAEKEGALSADRKHVYFVY
ncbi:conserved hypothetical protein [Culex quinquefasciatus]|uniref:Uncharacterized protein n=1 Tax=Culex quinquefasciatus TaxID=7176 RepID=B0XJ71_CULQU|nr:conserved hypothetical protein [Culex quinquefasciatus]|eukprot:XP_001869693.1 conserved hypothetical protein [Culex quinquefasciatus]